VQLDDRISWADLVAIITGLGVLATVVFGVQTDVEVNAKAIKGNAQNIEQVREEAHKDREEILERFDTTDRKMEVIRVEANDSSKWLGDKLDRLIERKLDR